MSAAISPGPFKKLGEDETDVVLFRNGGPSGITNPGLTNAQLREKVSRALKRRKPVSQVGDCAIK